MAHSARLPLAFALAATVAGCTPDMAPPTPFHQVQVDVFKLSCEFSSCHDASKQGGLDLTATDAYTQLVNAPSQWPQAMQQGLDRVKPGDITKSFLYIKLTLATSPDPTYGARMPNTGQTLGQSQLDEVKSWIEGGAPND